MAANESIVDPLVFLKKYLVFPFIRDGSALTWKDLDLEEFKRDI